MLETPKALPSLQVWTKKRWDGRRKLFNFAFLHLFHPSCQLLLGSTAGFYHIVHFFPSLNCYHKHSLLLYKRVNSSLVFLLSLRGEISVPGRLVCLPLSKQNWKTLRKSISKHLADTFIQSNLQGYTFVLSVCVFPGNRTHNLCAANAMLYHWTTGTHLWLSEVYFCDNRFNSWFSYTVGSIIIVNYLIIIQYADQWGVRSIIVV